MRTILCQAAAIALVWTAACAPATAQSAQSNPLDQASPHGKTAKPRRAAKPATTLSPSVTNLNAPSTDFSNVEPDTGEPHERRQRGPNVRPSIDSSGRPVMGLGF